MSAVSNAYNTWRQFSAGMGKLTPVGGTAPKFVPEPAQVDSKMDWAGQVFDVIGKSAKVFDVVKQESFDKAEEFMKTHSLEEYRKAVNENNIPFQNDPIAMARLKNLHGGVAANMAYQDFMNRVSNNEFKDMTPEQVDSEYFKHMDKSFVDLKDTFGYADGRDKAYNSGFWENGEKSRKSIMDAQVVVKNDWNRKQSTILETSNLNMRASDPNTTGEVLWEAFNSAYMGGAFNANPLESARIGEAMMKNLSNNPDGSRLIDELKARQIPGQKEGVTFGSLFGDDGLRTLKAKANGAKDEADFRSYADFAVRLTDLQDDDDMTGLETEMEKEMGVTGGAESARSKEILRAIVSLKGDRQRKAVAAEKEAAKQKEQNDKVINAMGVLGTLEREERTVPMKLAGTDHEAMDIAWEIRKQSIKPEKFLKLAKMNSDYNPAQKEFQSRLGNALNRILGDVQNSKGEVLLPAEMSSPKELEELMTMYNINPSDFMTASGGMRNDEFNTMVGVYNVMSNGTPYNQVVAGIAKFQQMDTAQRKELDKKLTKITLQDSGAESRGINSDYARTTVYAWAAYGMRTGMTDKEAYESAVTRFNETHINVGGTAVPSSFLTYNNADITPEVAGDAIDTHLQDILKRSGVAEKDVSVRFDPGRQVLCVQNNNSGTLLGAITQETLKPAYDKMVADEAQRKLDAEQDAYKTVERLKKSDELLKKHPSLDRL